MVYSFYPGGMSDSSGDYMNLASVAEEIQHRIIHIFGRDMEGRTLP